MNEPLTDQPHAIQQLTQYVREQARQFTTLQAQLEPMAALLARLPDVQRQVLDAEQRLRACQERISQTNTTHDEIVAQLTHQRRDVHALLQQEQAARGQARQAYEQEREQWRVALTEAQAALRQVEQEIVKKRAEGAQLTAQLQATVQTVLGRR